MSRQFPDPSSDADDELRRLFARAATHIDVRDDLAASVQRMAADGAATRPAGGARPFSIAATLSAIVVVALLVGVLTQLGRLGGRPGGGPGGSVATATPTRFTVSSVGLAVSPASIAGDVCGSAQSFGYVATFHIPAHTAGGTIQFAYTLNNGRSQTAASVEVSPGATTATYQFTSSGTLSPDHTYPAPALVLVTSPNRVESAAALPTGVCAAPGPFQVTGATMTVSPSSVAGLRCGSQLDVIYTATFHLAPNGAGGTINFMYTVNNGRGSTPARVTVAPGQTSATYVFHWSGALPADHTAPGGGGVITSSPNSVNSGLLGPSGMCQ
ncbi:MAG: hypothetical protein KGO05_10855 [Chloroflexota bacterium]|nr:hypothetical protein [Chloroflexota bacterium]